jgi:hypothetical protein
MGWLDGVSLIELAASELLCFINKEGLTFNVEELLELINSL